MLKSRRIREKIESNCLRAAWLGWARRRRDEASAQANEAQASWRWWLW
jgi:hypothetical protein